MISMDADAAVASTNAADIAAAAAAADNPNGFTARSNCGQLLISCKESLFRATSLLFYFEQFAPITKNLT